MSKQLDLSNPDSLSPEDAQYAFDRNLISEEQYRAATRQPLERRAQKVRVEAHETGSRLVPVEDGDEDEDTVIDYDASYNKDGIEELLIERELEYPKSGTKAEWIAILEADDAEDGD